MNTPTRLPRPLLFLLVFALALAAVALVLASTAFA
jgi:hypothetical protein